MGPDEIIAAYRLERHPDGGGELQVARTSGDYTLADGDLGGIAGIRSQFVTGAQGM